MHALKLEALKDLVHSKTIICQITDRVFLIMNKMSVLN